MRVSKYLSVVISLLLVGVASEAVQIRNSFYTLREKSMGGAITAAVDDYSTAYFNPANMASLEEGHLNMGFGGSFNSNLFSFMDDLEAFANETDNVQKAIKLKNFFDEYNGDVHTINPFLYGMYSGKKWGFGFIPMNTDAQISVFKGTAVDYSDSYVDIQSYLDGVMFVSYAAKWKEDLQWGVNLKGIYRGYYGKKFLGSEISSDDLFVSKDAKFGMSVDADLGLTYDLPKRNAFDPKLSLVVRNVVDQGFTINPNSEGKPPKLQRRFDLGSEFKFERFWVFTPRVTFDIRDMGVKDWDFQSGYHLGAELNWKVYDWLRGGYRVGLNQGYFTAGIDMRFAWFRLDLATWGEEVGTKKDRKELRRTALNLSLDF